MMIRIVTVIRNIMKQEPTLGEKVAVLNIASDIWRLDAGTP